MTQTRMTWDLTGSFAIPIISIKFNYMKKKLYTLLMATFLFMGMAFSQDVLLQSFDDPATIGNWQNSTAGSYTLEAASEHQEGTGAVVLNYNLVGDQGWGGSVDMRTESGSTFGDLTDTDGISLWYKVISPNSADANLTIKLIVNSSGGQEEWHTSLFTVLNDASGEWQQVKVPYTSFAIPSWLQTLDGVLYQDQIATIDMQVLTSEGTTTAGEILFDALTTFQEGGTVIGTLLEDFEETGDIASWQNSNDGSHNISSSSDAVEGSASACLDYILIADQDWGGSIDMQFMPADSLYPDLDGETGIRFNYKVTQPASNTSGVNWTVKIFINSQGELEQWHANLNYVLGDDTGEWQEAKIPFSAFAIPSWETTYDGILHLDEIRQIEMQVVSGTMGTESNGTVCLDNLTSYNDGDVELFEAWELNSMEAPSTIPNWINSNDGSHSVYHADGVVGDSAACVNYNLVGDQGWGGSVDMEFLPADTNDLYLPDMTDHLGISFYYKVNTPASTPGNVSFVVKIFVESTGGVEEYHRTIGGVLVDPSGDWVQVYSPFDAHAIPSWQTSYDGVLYQDKITKVQFQILGQEGTTTTGDICFDHLTSYDDEEFMVSTVTPVSADVKVYPNPASYELFIEGLEHIESIHVFNMSGSLVKTVNGLNQVNVADLYSGLYIMKIHTDFAVYSAKFMKH